MTGAGRLTRGMLSSYFLLLVIFLYAPLVVLVIFAFNDSTSPRCRSAASPPSGSTRPSATPI